MVKGYGKRLFASETRINTEKGYGNFSPLEMELASSIIEGATPTPLRAWAVPNPGHWKPWRGVPGGVRALEGVTGRVEPLECKGGPFLPSCGLGPLDTRCSVGGRWMRTGKKRAPGTGSALGRSERISWMCPKIPRRRGCWQGGRGWAGRVGPSVYGFPLLWDQGTKGPRDQGHVE